MTRLAAPPALTPEALRLVDAYWRAANYLAVGQIARGPQPGG